MSCGVTAGKKLSNNGRLRKKIGLMRAKSPIATYGGLATTKEGVNQKAHTIVYSGDKPPQPLPGEEKMNKDPLRVELVIPEEKLDPRSRLNLGRAHVIDHNFKVQDIGMIDERSLPKLLAYRRDVMDDQNRV